MVAAHRVVSVFVCLSALVGSAAADDWWRQERQFPNLVHNPSFEVPAPFDDKDCLHWVEHPNVMRDTSTAHNGKASLRAEGPGQFYVRPRRITGLIPGAEYSLSAWLRTEKVTGKGAAVAFFQHEPAGRLLGESSRISGSSHWTEVRTDFRTPAEHRTGVLRLCFELKEGEVAWVDDVSLEPAGGQVPVAPAPKIEPDGGAFEGAVMVRLETDLPGAEIRCTTDGSDPTVFSSLYKVPVRLSGPATVKARVFHCGHRQSPVERAAFDVKPCIGTGVPFYPMGRNQDVESWWAGHVYNPDSPIHVKEIESPEPVINVADVRDKHPESTTAGVQEALDILPPQGGTLWFDRDRGPYTITEAGQALKHYYEYSGAIFILRRNNIHFLSDGATITCSSPVFVVYSMEYPDEGTVERPSCNFYFKNIVFDGKSEAAGAVRFQHCANVLFDDCVFQNYRDAAIVAQVKTDNIWCRTCCFDSGKHGVLWDGVHNGGLLNCRISREITGSAMVLFTNSDMNITANRLSVDMRNGEYIVVSGCTFEGARRSHTISSMAANLLCVNNQVRGPYDAFVSHHGMGTPRHVWPFRYRADGLRIVGNHLEDVNTVARFWWDVPSTDRGLPNVLRNNVARRLESVVRLEPRVEYMLQWYPTADYTEIADITVRDNDFSGEYLPGLQADRKYTKKIKRIVLTDNKLSGKERALLTDLEGEPLEADGIAIEGNEINLRRATHLDEAERTEAAQWSVRTHKGEAIVYRLAPAWKFACDPDNVGLSDKWFASRHDDSQWAPTRTDRGNGWERQGFPDYTGFGWYRQVLELPAQLGREHLYLHFEAVDEDGYIYLNGKAAFEHSCSSTGLEPDKIWVTPFAFDARPYLEPGGPNTIAVRVYSRAGMGGIWKPVYLISCDEELALDALGQIVRKRAPEKS